MNVTLKLKWLSKVQRCADCHFNNFFIHKPAAYINSCVIFPRRVRCRCGGHRAWDTLEVYLLCSPLSPALLSGVRRWGHSCMCAEWKSGLCSTLFVFLNGGTGWESAGSRQTSCEFEWSLLQCKLQWARSLTCFHSCSVAKHILTSQEAKLLQSKPWFRSFSYLDCKRKGIGKGCII